MSVLTNHLWRMHWFFNSVKYPLGKNAQGETS